MAIKKKKLASTKATTSATRKTNQRAKSGRSSKSGTKAKKKAPREKIEASGSGAESKETTKRAPTVPRRPMMEKTFFAKFGSTPQKWRLIDANGATLGRLSSYIATALMGKDRPTYTRHSDTGDHVVVINAEKIVLTGNKETQKKYYRHSNYPGGLREETAEAVRTRHPERLVQLAVYRMLPRGHMGRRWFKNLRVFAGPNHPHTAQKPEVVKLPQSVFNSRESA